MTERPGGLKPVCVIAITLGSMGLAGALFGVVSQVAQPRLKMPGEGPKFEELNAEFERRLRELSREMSPYYWGLLPFAVAASALLLAGGIMGLKSRGWGVLNAAFGGSLVVDLASAIIGGLTQSKSMELLQWHQKELSALRGSPSEIPGAMFVPLMIMLTMVGGWLIAKTVYYVWGLIYLRKTAVRAAFSPPTAPP